MKLHGLSEQYDGGRAVFVQQEGPHVLLSVEAGPDCTTGVTLLTPAQARSVSDALTRVAAIADQVEELEGSS